MAVSLYSRLGRYGTHRVRREKFIRKAGIPQGQPLIYAGTYVTSCTGGLHNLPPPLQVELCPFDLESGVRVTCDVGYLCANFSLPSLSVLDLGPM